MQGLHPLALGLSVGILWALGVVVMGLTAVPVGRWIDEHGARGMMTSGSLTSSPSVAMRP